MFSERELTKWQVFSERVVTTEQVFSAREFNGQVVSERELTTGTWFRRGSQQRASVSEEGANNGASVFGEELTTEQLLSERS